MPLRIVIVGAGIAGLCAAVALRHAGHSVQVLLIKVDQLCVTHIAQTSQIIEKSQFASEIGAALAIAPNGARVLSSLGFCFKRTRAWNLPCWESVDGRTLRSLFHMDLTDCPTRFGEGFMAIHRVDLHNELLKLALEGTDNPALLRLGITAEDVDAIDGSLFLSDGTKCQADLIVGADGTHSAIRHSVLKLMDQPTMTDMSAFRFLVPTDRIENEGSLSDLYKWKSSGTTIFVDTSDKAVERHLVWYPCRG
ncbi:MAG: hypothetical protein LQ342_007537 [Letrouitia transgressa]|nr:MAG: hypothetical protein LQ342_007537 [Letrouitia transgressa]